MVAPFVAAAQPVDSAVELQPVVVAVEPIAVALIQVSPRNLAVLPATVDPS